MWRKWILHKACKLPKKILSDIKKCRDWTKRHTLIKTHLRHKACERNKVAWRNDKSIKSQTSCRPIGTFDLTNNRDVLCQERYIKIKWYNKWIWYVEYRPKRGYFFAKLMLFWCCTGRNVWQRNAPDEKLMLKMSINLHFRVIFK